MGNLDFMAGDTTPETGGDFEPPAIGWHKAWMITGEMKRTSNGEGMGANCSFQILDDGADQGKKVFFWFNLQHSNEKAQSIGRGQFRRLARCCGYPDYPDDLSDLFERPVMIKIAHEEQTYDGKTTVRGIIKDFKELEGATKKKAVTPVETEDEEGGLPF